MSFTRWLTPDDFECAREDLINYRSTIKCDGKWVMTRLENLANVVRAQEASA